MTGPSMTDRPAIHLAHVSKAYVIWRRLRRRLGRGVHDVSLTVPRGVIYGLLGLNGAGKTTTMKMLVGLLRPDAGRIRVLGGEPSDPGTRARIGFLPELPYLPLQLDARTVLTAYGRMSGLAGRHLSNRVQAVLERTGLTGRDREPLREFSKGMLQRTAMAQVLLHDPEIVFADEPLSGLDPKGIREMRELLLALKAAGLTVILNSHQISEVERVCDRVGVMVDGRLVRSGPTGELLASATVRRYRVTVLARTRNAPGSPAGRGSAWHTQDFETDERALAPALARERARGARILQILAIQGSLEEALLETIRSAGPAPAPGAARTHGPAGPPPVVPIPPRSAGIARYVLKVLLRGRMIALLAGAGVAGVLGSFVLTYLTPGTEHRTFLDAAYLLIELLAVLTPVLGATLLMVQEFEQRTLWLVLIRPPTRAAYVRGRFWGLAAAAASVILATAAVVGGLLFAARALPDPWLAPVAGAAVLEAAVVSATACLVTFGTTSWVTAALVDLGIVVLGYLSALLPVLAGKPALALVRPLLLAVYWLLPHLSAFAVRDFAEPPETWYMAALCGYAAAYTGAMLALAAWTFHRREI